MRFSPCFASSLFHAKSPYLSSPASGNPRCVRCTRIWCVRPVRSSASSRRAADRGAATRSRAGRWSPPPGPSRRRPARAARLPWSRTCAAPAAPAAARRASGPARGRRSACPRRRREAARAGATSARRFLARSMHARRVAVEPVDELEEPRLGPRRAHLLDQAGGDAAAAVHREARRLVDDDDARPRTGCGTRARVHGRGRRTGRRRGSAARARRRRSPSRASGPTRPLFTRTSPLRRIRYTWLFGTPFSSAQEEIVDALARRFLADRHLRCSILAQLADWHIIVRRNARCRSPAGPMRPQLLDPPRFRGPRPLSHR